MAVTDLLVLISTLLQNTTGVYMQVSGTRRESKCCGVCELHSLISPMGQNSALRASNSCPIGGEVKFPHTAALRFRLNVPDTCIYTPVVFCNSVLIKTGRSVTATAQLKQNVSKNNNYGRSVCGM